MPRVLTACEMFNILRVSLLLHGTIIYMNTHKACVMLILTKPMENLGGVLLRLSCVPSRLSCVSSCTTASAPSHTSWHGMPLVADKACHLCSLPNHALCVAPCQIMLSVLLCAMIWTFWASPPAMLHAAVYPLLNCSLLSAAVVYALLNCTMPVLSMPQGKRRHLVGLVRRSRHADTAPGYWDCSYLRLARACMSLLASMLFMPGIACLP